MKYNRLMEPITIKNLTLKNRLVMPAIHLQYCDNGAATEKFNEYFWRRAEGGAGLILAGGCCLDHHEGYAGIMSLSEDRFIPGFTEFVDGMHARGTKVGVQFLQTGRYGRKKYISGDTDAIAPSAVYSGYTRETPRAMTIDEIHQVIKDWTEAALRAVKCGFDVIEITAGSGYLLSQFLSPVTNLREDEYGGSWEKRCRFPVELVTAIRGAIGPDFPLFMRVAGNDFIKGGNTNTECVEFCKLMEKTGIDAFNVTGGWHETGVPQLPGDVPRGGFVYLAKAVKDAVHVPVMAANRFNDPYVAEKALALGEADLIGVGRTLIADPDFPKKIAENRVDEIRHCLACNQGCLGRMFFDQPLECLVNGKVGREAKFKNMYNNTAAPKNILVVGAGPAGCEFAIESAKRGNHITLMEKKDHIGGALDIVCVPPSKQEFATLPKYFEAMLKKTGVNVILNHEVSAAEIKEGKYDAVVIASGASIKPLSLEGCDGITVCTAEDILTGSVIAGKDVVMIGGGSVGCETAAYMAHEASISPEELYFMESWRSESPEKIKSLLNSCSRNISIVDMAKIGAGFDPGCGWPVLADLKRLGVRQYPLSTITEIKDGIVSIDAKDKKTGQISQVHIKADTIVTAVGYKSENTLYESLKDSGIEIYNIGDSHKVGKVLDAIHQADDLALEI